MDDRRIFVALADTGSFAGTARRLGMARSTVLRRIGALEQELGVALVRRVGHRIDLTEGGRTYARALRGIFGELERAEQDLHQDQGRLAGTLRIWLPMFATGTAFARGVAAFQRRHPEVALAIELGRDVRTLEVGRFDVAMQYGLRHNPELVARPIYREQLLIVGTPTYLDEAGVPTRPADLMGHRIVQVHDHEGRRLGWRGPEGRVSLPDPSAEVSSVVLAYELARGHAGLARVPRLLAQPALTTGEVVHVLPAVVTDDPVSFVFPPEPPPVTRAFVTFMLERFGELVQQGLLLR